MAKRRCISVDFYESDYFLTLSDKEKLLYTSLIVRCDDEGVIINPTIALRLNSADKNDLENLVKKNFLIKIDDMYVIRHWHRHNKISPSKLNASIYQSVLDKLYVNEALEYTMYYN